jgi:hypothetical protein
MLSQPIYDVQMSQADSLVPTPPDPDALPNTYMPTLEERKELAAKFGDLISDGQRPDLFKYNLTLAGLMKLAKEGAELMHDPDGTARMRIVFVKRNGKRFAIVWPGKLANHGQVEAVVKNTLDDAEVFNNGTVPAKKMDERPSTFEFETLKNWADTIAANIK